MSEACTFCHTSPCRCSEYLVDDDELSAWERSDGDHLNRYGARRLMASLQSARADKNQWFAEAAKQATRAMEATRRAEVAEAALREYQWVATDYNGMQCPACEMEDRQGHSSECPIAKILNRGIISIKGDAK